MFSSFFSKIMDYILLFKVMFNLRCHKNFLINSLNQHCPTCIWAVWDTGILNQQRLTQCRCLISLRYHWIGIGVSGTLMKPYNVWNLWHRLRKCKSRISDISWLYSQFLFSGFWNTADLSNPFALCYFLTSSQIWKINLILLISESRGPRWSWFAEKTR